MDAISNIETVMEPQFQKIEVISSSWNRVSQIDLSPIAHKLVSAEHGKGWILDDAKRAERLYRCFLTLQLAYQGRKLPIVPFEVADEFWHQHILDTRKYMSDCDKLFGEYLHHFPYFGMRGEEDAKNLAKAGNFTMALFQEHFPEDANQILGKCSACARCASCSSS
jgi:hypothetical protein